MSLPIPEYLENWLVPDCSDHNEYKVSGAVECLCGNTTFKVDFVGEEDDQNVYSIHIEEHPNPEYNDYFALVIHITCTQCARTHTLYDRHQHGWNGYIAVEGKGFPFTKEMLHSKSCKNCGKTNFKLQTSIYSMGKVDFTENAPDRPKEQWVNAFERITVDLACTDCGHAQTNWLDDECM